MAAFLAVNDGIRQLLCGVRLRAEYQVGVVLCMLACSQNFLENARRIPERFDARFRLHCLGAIARKSGCDRPPMVNCTRRQFQTRPCKFSLAVHLVLQHFEIP
jgi:hypothetical protein